MSDGYAEANADEKDREKSRDDAILKHNLLQLVDDHKVTCLGEDCAISLSMLLLLALRAGIEFTDEERKLFA